jgi:hypothetical protein
MGALISYIRPTPVEHQTIVHDVYLRCQAVEMTYETMIEREKGNGFYPTRIVFSIALGHSDWNGFLDCILQAYKIDPVKVEKMYWAVWATKQIPTFSEDSGEVYTPRSKIINDRTDAKILAGYIIDADWDFYLTLEHHATTGMFTNSLSPVFNSHLRPTETDLMPHKKQTDSV